MHVSNKNVREFYEMLFNEHKPAEDAKRYMGENIFKAIIICLMVKRLSVNIPKVILTSIQKPGLK
jgi:hypothetical protein